MNNKQIFLSICIPFLVVYIHFVYKTPGFLFDNTAPFWETGRITITLLWMSSIYFVRWRPNIENAWSPKCFLIGLVTGGGFLFPILAYSGLLGYIKFGTILFSSILCGLFSSPSRSGFSASLLGFLFFVLQGLTHFLIFSGYQIVI